MNGTCMLAGTGSTDGLPSTTAAMLCSTKPVCQWRIHSSHTGLETCRGTTALTLVAQLNMQCPAGTL